MRTVMGTAAVVLALVLGCSRAPQSIPTLTANSELHGYKFVFVYPEGTARGVQGRRVDDGAGQVIEDITATCGEQTLRIVNGKVTLNGSDRGTTKQGDSIKLTPTGKLWVNDQPRGE